jgi:hypothetical protein
MIKPSSLNPQPTPTVASQQDVLDYVSDMSLELADLVRDMGLLELGADLKAVSQRATRAKSMGSNSVGASDTPI